MNNLKNLIIILSLKNVEIEDVDEILCFYMKEHNKEFNQGFLKGEFKLVFDDNEDCKYIITGMNDDRTFTFWSSYLRDAIKNFKKERYHFNHITELDIVTLAHQFLLKVTIHYSFKISKFTCYHVFNEILIVL